MLSVSRNGSINVAATAKTLRSRVLSDVRRGNVVVRRFGVATATPEEREAKYVLPTYGSGGLRSKKGMLLDHGKGSVLYDTEGNSYLDFASGIAVNILGHGDDKLAEAVYDQMKKIAHASNLYHTEPYLALAEELINVSPGFQKVFFCNSGTEANEGAIKFARLTSNHLNDNDRSRTVAFQGSFHGRSLGALSLTYKPAIRAPFTPLLNQNVTHVPFNDIKALEEVMGDDVMCMFLEPVQGEGGVTPATREFMQAARELCDKYNSVLVFDEVQIGLGRSGNGHIWGYEEYGIVPDILTAAKPLAGGLPIGCILLSERVCRDVPNSAWLGVHGSTFAGSPVTCRAASVVLDRLIQPSFLENIKIAGSRFIQGLVEIADKYPEKIVQVRRPLGDAALYAGIQVKVPAASIIKNALERGVLIISAGDKGDVVRLCPPLVTTVEQVEVALKVIDESFAAVDAPEPELIIQPVSPGKQVFGSKSDHENFIKSNSALPEGFRVGTSTFEFFPEELGNSNKKAAVMNLTVIQPDVPTNSYAAMFTQNAFPGAPVKIGKSILAKNQKLGAVIINNKISNVSPRNGGVDDASAVCDQVHSVLKLDADAKVFPSSTGVIGWRLPVSNMIAAIPEAVANLQRSSFSKAASAIMTTDAYPKARSVTVVNQSGETLGRITGIAKGAGMIEPNMATMLVYILTDMDVPDLQSHLAQSVNGNGSFNSVSVDSDQSTSDTILLISSSQVKKPESISERVWSDAFQAGLKEVCTSLAHDVVRNGEGVEHVMKISVIGAPSEALAKGVGKAVVNSPLCKTAVAGNDPNVGRLIGSVGDYVGKVDPDLAKRLPALIKINVGGETVFKGGEFDLDGDKEVKLTQYMIDTKQSLAERFPPHEKTLDITIDLGSGNYRSVILGADLTTEYVHANAGYRS
mmetsp:Transcript_35631/g.44152  ORF Transcript_35631/g.44152 Transcript_35631/m.44152 type:complete len:917 (+) Transcript_35631:193-2943(+)|eukprot:CAMPEP_0204826882 /NCGR_PEP_ID=MMETSP1346-20131115/4490_1 /ASSEMBLY_ACC=CAM_ASM_000771 /TAXON_ID=215587 /ORGANISM="Aplanochytrium stocchinoi, Strain GSBS06" /LENGTH=916 /DNA_ID=CAMNT_0051955111 /DNA_START=92 /DNA_END=2842 /DNA_ORIENTATION=-